MLHGSTKTLILVDAWTGSHDKTETIFHTCSTQHEWTWLDLLPVPGKFCLLRLLFIYASDLGWSLDCLLNVTVTATMIYLVT